MTFRSRLLPLSAAVLLGSTLLSACAPLLIGGAAVSSALMYSDRRTSGAQLEDESIEFKAAKRLREQFGDKAHLSVTSYNRIALLTGEVASDADRAAAETTLAGIENVRTVVNESAVAAISSLSARSNDLVLTSKVKASFIDAKDLQANAIKVVTERGVVYLMGRVTEREASRAVEIARGVGGVYKVVRAFELLTEDELKALQPAPAPARKN